MSEREVAPTVSVVIPVFNVARWLDRCLASVTSQTHTALDIILVDDGSTDGSGVLCDAWAQRDPRVRVIHQANQGLSAARNAGIESMTGRYVTFVDSDDWIHSDMIRRLLRASYPQASVAIAGFQRTDGSAPLDAAPTGHPVRLSSQEALARLLGPHHTSMTTAWGKLFSRDVVSQVRFPPGRLHEDEFVAHRFLLAAEDVTVVDEPLYYYHVRDSSIMGSAMTPQRGRDSIDAERLRADDLLLNVTPDLAAIAWRHLVRRIIKVLCWAVKQGQHDTVATLKSEVHALRRDRRWQTLPYGIKLLARLAAVSPALTCRIVTARGKLSAPAR